MATRTMTHGSTRYGLSHSSYNTPPPKAHTSSRTILLAAPAGGSSGAPASTLATHRRRALRVCGAPSRLTPEHTHVYTTGAFTRAFPFDSRMRPHATCTASPSRG